MNRPIFLCKLSALVTILGLCGLVSCVKKSNYQDKPGPGSTLQIKIKDKALDCEIALDEETRRTGLMFREPGQFTENQGMLFVWRRTELQRFHMKNTKIPLSIAFISEEGEILQIEDMKPYDERLTLSKMRVRYALEVNKGWFRNNGIEVGDKFVDFETSLSDLGSR